jgi:HD-GYP domain-containing protein (c-di-GMP phosphodiesterase class II)
VVLGSGGKNIGFCIGKGFKMNKIDAKKIKAGDIFTEPVFVEGDNMFVPAKSPIRQKDINKLNAWGVDTVETEGVILDDADANAGPEQKPDSGPPLARAQEDKGPYRTYKTLIELLDKAFAGIKNRGPVDTRSFDYIASQILQDCSAQRKNYIGFILAGKTDDHEQAKSSINTAILAALIAYEFKLPGDKIAQITTGALLHDVGMFRLPGAIFAKQGGLSSAELQQIQSHPLHGYQITTKILSYPDEIGLIVLQHHERWDGAGYPRKTAGTAIDPGARIVSVADAFEAMISQKPYRNSMVGYQAMKNLMADNARRFDPGVLKAFIRIMGIYPIGSVVLLNNRVLARVIDVRAEAPLRPKIHLLSTESGQFFKPDQGDIIDLSVEKNLFIVKALDPKELAGKN